MKKSLTLCIITIIGSLSLFFLRPSTQNQQTSKELKLYWFIPDGLRSENEVFTVFEWARQGLLPNIKKLMDNGSYGHSIPVFPGHTPTNFATLLTGFYPETHGINDGPMRVPGYSLQRVVKGGFQSTTRKIDAIWTDLEKNDYKSVLISVPGSTPPEIRNGIVIRGRWGNWGVEFPSVVLQSEAINQNKELLFARRRLFEMDKELTHIVQYKNENRTTSFNYNLWGVKYDGVITSDRNLNLKIQSSKSYSINLKEDDWSEWLDVDLIYALKEVHVEGLPKPPEWERKLSEIKTRSQMRVKAIRIKEGGDFRLRIQFNALNEFLIYPSEEYTSLNKYLGPMVDFVDNYPPQLIYFPEDKKTFLEESKHSALTHKKIVSYAVKELKANSVVHNTYTPNQMLTSRWWLGYLDPKSPRYNEVDEAERKKLWEEVLDMYKDIDNVVGEILKNSGPNTVIVFSSDHGAIPLHREVRLNNLFAKEGLLKTKADPVTGLPQVDWTNSKVVFLKMDSIYLNPKGLGGIYQKSGGQEYDELKKKVINLLKNLKDINGIAPLADIIERDQALRWRLDPESTGDLVIANTPYYNWTETLTTDLEVFSYSMSTGYKQAVLPKENIGMWTPFIIAGPGIKKGFKIESPINHVDQIPTIIKALKIDISRQWPGVVPDIFTSND